MLAEKFFLFLETILSNRRTDVTAQIRSKSPFIPIVKTPLSSDVGRMARETREEAGPARGPDLITD